MSILLNKTRFQLNVLPIFFPPLILFLDAQMVNFCGFHICSINFLIFLVNDEKVSFRYDIDIEITWFVSIFHHFE